MLGIGYLSILDDVGGMCVSLCARVYVLCVCMCMVKEDNKFFRQTWPLITICTSLFFLICSLTQRGRS